MNNSTQKQYGNDVEIFGSPTKRTILVEETTLVELLLVMLMAANTNTFCTLSNTSNNLLI